MLTIEYNHLGGEFEAFFNGTLQESSRSLTRLLEKLASLAPEIESEIKHEHE